MNCVIFVVRLRVRGFICFCEPSSFDLFFFFFFFQRLGARWVSLQAAGRGKGIGGDADVEREVSLEHRAHEPGKKKG